MLGLDSSVPLFRYLYNGDNVSYRWIVRLASFLCAEHCDPCMEGIMQGQRIILSAKPAELFTFIWDFQRFLIPAELEKSPFTALLFHTIAVENEGAEMQRNE